MAEDNNMTAAPDAGTAAPTTQQTQQTPQADAAATSPTDVANALLKALEAKSKQTERSVSRSFAEQYGLSEQEVSQLLEAEKARRASALPPEAQKRIDDAITVANDRLIAADIKAQAVALGCVDTDAAIALIDRTNLKVDEHGGVTGVDEALKALKTSKGYLFGARAWGERQTTPAGDMDGVEAAFRKRNPNLKID